MSKAYKIIYGVAKVDKEKFFSLPPNIRTRGHPINLTGERFALDKRKHFFTKNTMNL